MTAEDGKQRPSADDCASTIHFALTIDGLKFGSFTECSGLEMEVEIEKYEEGGNADYVHQLPGRISYSNIQLTRPLTKESAALAHWLQTLQPGFSRAEGSIAALLPTGTSDPFVTWSLEGVIPVKWTGPKFDVNSPGVATETLEIAHTGFKVAPVSEAKSPAQLEKEGSQN
jgi:phage tail-like protein